MMESILRALSMAFAMGWEILRSLILGFTLSAVVQAVVSHREMARLLPRWRPPIPSPNLASSCSRSWAGSSRWPNSSVHPSWSHC
jgi:uncharacterized membrane protein YraQ (UPF0718 family)